MNAVVPRPLPDTFSFVIADDHPSVSLAVVQICQTLLGVDKNRLTTAQCTRELLDICAKPSPRPRIIVLDLVMPGELKRAALVRAALQADPTARVVVYSADESAFLVKALMTAEAMAYVSKSSPTRALVEAIRAVSEDRPYIDERIDMRALDVHPWSTLTDSEKAVLLAFCRGSKAVDIAALTGKSYSTVMTHKYNGIAKLELRGENELIPYLYANGLICELDDGGQPETGITRSARR